MSNSSQVTDTRRLTGPEARALIRSGGWRRTTAGMAQGWVQANLVILPQAYADDFMRFCQSNPKPCPVMDVTEPGSAEPRRVAPGADLRTDLPRYRVYRKGAFVGERDTISDLWRADLVAFLLGCSYTFEQGLIRAGIRMRHLELGGAVPMYRTNLACEPAGPFKGTQVVSMRPIPEPLVEQAIRVTERFPRAHSGPVHVGDPAQIGIADVSRPDYGDSVPIYPGEIPVFWACGVTPQTAAEAAGIELMLTHAPGRMFITDLKDEDLEDG